METQLQTITEWFTKTIPGIIILGAVGSILGFYLLRLLSILFHWIIRFSTEILPEQTERIRTWYIELRGRIVYRYGYEIGRHMARFEGNELLGAVIYLAFRISLVIVWLSLSIASTLLVIIIFLGQPTGLLTFGIYSLIVVSLLFAYQAIKNLFSITMIYSYSDADTLIVTRAGLQVEENEAPQETYLESIKPLTLLSGREGKFSLNKDGPWSNPVLCNPIHGEWEVGVRDIEGAKWVWIKEKPSDVEAQRGQTVWHQLTFDIGEGRIESAILILMVDDFVSLSINGKNYSRTVNMKEHVVKIDLTSYICTGLNEILMAIENAAHPSSTPESNPTGIIYRLEIL